MTRDDLLTFDGSTQSVAEWALDYGIPSALILSRLRRGLSNASAITLPMKVKPGEKLDDDVFFGRRGAGSNLKAFEGTGAGSTAQETPDIDFSELDRK